MNLGIVNAFILRDETLTLVDTGASKRSAKLSAAIAELDFDTAVFGHGTVLRGKANSEFRRFAENVASS